MEATQPLRNLLADLGQAFNSGDRVDIVFPGENVDTPDGTQQAPASMATTPDGTVILNPDIETHYDVDLDGPNQLRLLIDALHHEIEHVRQTDLGQKGDIADEHGPNAATLFNLVEDQYINRTRTTRHRGRRRDLAYKAEVAVMANMEPVDQVPGPRRLTSALCQLCWGGYVKGFKNLSDDEKQFIAWARRRINDARYTDDQEGRVAIAVEIADRLNDLVDHTEWELPEGVQFVVVQKSVDTSGADAGQPMPAPDDAEADEEEDADGSGSGDGEEDDDADAGQPGSGDDVEDETPAEPPRPGEDMDLDDDIEALEDCDDAGDEKAPRDDSMKWYGPQPYDAPDTMVNRYERVRREEEHRDTDLGYYEQKRDIVLSNYSYDYYASRGRGDPTPLDAWPPYRSRYPREDEPDYRKYRDFGWAEVREEYDSELADEIEDVFRQFKTRPRETPSRSGPRLHRPNVVRHLAGERGLPLHQRRTTRQELGDRVVGVAVDSSGSMGGDKELAAKKAIAAIAQACEVIGDEFVATTFQITYDDNHDLGLMTGPGEEFEWEHLDAMVTGSAECPAPGALFTADLMDRVGAREKVMVVIHDGMPHVGLEAGVNSTEAAVEDMAKTVNTLRDDGYMVVGMGVGDGIEPDALDDMFGHDGWVHVGVDDLTDGLVQIYQDQMNVNIGGGR